MLKSNAIYKFSSTILYISSYDVTTNSYHGRNPEGKIHIRVKRREESQYTYCGSFMFLDEEELQTYMQTTYPEYYV
jgi:hypothetical protein